MSVSKAVQGGLVIGKLHKSADGTSQYAVTRFIPASTLLRRYRMHLKKFNAEFQEMTSALRRDGASVKGFAHIPNPPLSFTHDQPLRRGRPKKRPIA